MTVIGRIVERVVPLPPVTTRKVTVERGLKIPMDDGVTLVADHWAPRITDGTSLSEIPVVLVRTPYGRTGLLAWVWGTGLAERGMQVLMVSSRGTFGSGGEFRPMHDERADGLAVLRWLVEQPWAVAGIVLAGSSYFGYTQWAVAAEVPPQVKAMVPHMTSSRLVLAFNPPGRFDLESTVGFIWNTAPRQRNGRPRPPRQERRGYLLGSLLGIGRDRFDRALRTLPLTAMDTALLGRRSEFLQELLRHDQDDPHWQKDVDHGPSVGDATLPVSAVTGWFDIFLHDQLRDYRRLVDAGRPPRLTIGPWWHADPRTFAAAVEETVSWAAVVACGEAPAERAPVRLFVMGIDQWRDFGQWPPEGYVPQRWHLHPHGALARGPAAVSEPTAFTYDPSDPTPALGGALLFPRGAGPVDNTPVEARSDVVTFTSPVLDADLEVIGELAARMWLRADRPSCDLFVRLCDVDADGTSVNVCDNIVPVRLQGVTEATVALSPTAHVFRRGHRIRVQVSGGAFPRFARDLGGGEPLASAATPHRTRIEVLHDAEHRSSILLPAKA